MGEEGGINVLLKQLVVWKDLKSSVQTRLTMLMLYNYVYQIDGFWNCVI